MYRETTQELIEFIAKCPSCYHTVNTISEYLQLGGYTELFEGEQWRLQEEGKYFVTRNRSSIIAFRIPNGSASAFMLTASHSESPCFKIKPNPEMPQEGCYVKLNTEGYGGMIYSSWLDRPLSVAGRITVSTKTGISTVLVNIDRDLLVIPNVAIHLNRKINDGYVFNPQKDLLPLFGDEEARGEFMPLISREAGIDEKNILGMDLFVYNRSSGTVWGNSGEYVSAPRLDDLQCAFGTLRGFLEGENKNTVPVYCVFDNEETGSGTKQGAKSTFLYNTLWRIAESLGKTSSGFMQMLSSSFMLSADNGHAVHPNCSEISDPVNRPKINGGVLIKYNAAQKYTTDAVSDAIFRKICRNAGVPVQEYVNRSDIPGGTTLGNILTEKVSINIVDIGLAQLAMHSAYETAGVKDTEYLRRAVREFYKTCIEASADGEYSLVKQES